MTSLLSISAFARQNEKGISTSYKGLTLSVGITAFDSHLHEKLQSSINLSHKAFIGSLKTGRYLSAYEFIGKANTAELKKHFGPKYSFRIPFDALFTDGDKMKYFALNSGNMGMPSLWGRYCMVFRLNYFKDEYSAVLRQNSLAKQTDNSHYYFNGKAPDSDKILAEICPLQMAKEQCVIKKHKEADTCLSSLYPELVCKSNIAPKDFRSSDYVELLTTQDCLLDKNYMVRMREAEYNLIFTATFDSYGADELKDNKRALDRETDEFVDVYTTYKFDIDVLSV